MTIGPDLRCYYHPEVAATSQCDMCGDYLCDECVSVYLGDHLCRTCEDDVRGLRVGVFTSYATTVLALLSLAAPVPVLMGVIAMRDEAWIPLLLAAIVLLGPPLVLIGMRRHNKVDVSLAFGNGALVPLLVLSVLSSSLTIGVWYSFAVLAFVCEFIGLLLAVSAWASDDGSALELLFAFFAPMLWIVCMLVFVWLL